ncbi:MerR family transcriptional regulator [Aeromicrobium sp. Sec7.5]|uniref:MerR family transcriptional regulator n=1 Tax=Aeromicrobium sp. Sec7.5 TaxID=3121276 RepID=UPI002FE4645D
MTSTMTIGDFSRATRLSAKALRHYHRLGLLEPAEVDTFTGYRSYSVEQVADAQLIRHFRSLEMPLDVISQVLSAEESVRSELIGAHLQRMEQRLAETRDAVTALRSLLASGSPAAAVERRVVDATPALVVRDVIDLTDLGEWFTAAQIELDRAVESSGLEPTGALGGLWSTELIRDEAGDVALFRPIAAVDHVVAMGRVEYEVLPATVLAVATHSGSDATIGQVYAELGAHVAQYEVSLDGPIRETYLAGVPGGEGVTEIGWPVRA